ncbi:multidrug transporter subunit MdtD [Peredibacter sp. HCB2-198]|uniref:multidrug transporter subunit MdtD n=1 Tax=Peredibacter sp. HCB2-198 TaxID=3383025 RepID=UPI0038B5EB77
MESSSSDRTLLWLVAIGFFMETLDSTIVNTALSSMARDLGKSPFSMQLVIISYALTLAVLIPLSGWLTDRFGTKRVYLGAIITFTASSLLCAMAPTLNWLIFARVLQGAGGSMLLPVGRLAILRAFPGERYLPALSFVAMPALLGPLVGPTLGGWIVQYFSWHWIFLINIPIGIIGCFATWKAMPQDDFIIKRKFDILGFTQLSVFMVCVSVAFDAISEKQFSYGVILFLFIFGLASLVSYALKAAKNHEALLSLELFKTRTYSIGILGNLFARIGAGCMPFLLPLFLQTSLGYSPLESGMAMLPLAFAAILAKKIVLPIVTHFGYRKFLIGNTIFVGLGIASFYFTSNLGNEYLRMLQFFIFGAFNSMQFTAMNTLTMKDLEKRLSSHGNTMFSMVQMLSMSFSVAAASSLLSTFLSTHEMLRAFHMTFFCMGALTCTSAWIFGQLNLVENVEGKVSVTTEDQ